jgi:hypothetical protein
MPPKLPGPLELKLTVPVGVLPVPLVVSVTVAIHVEDCPTVTLTGEQLTSVDVGCPTTVTVWLPPLVAWVGSPP